MSLATFATTLAIFCGNMHPQFPHCDFIIVSPEAECIEVNSNIASASTIEETVKKAFENLETSLKSQGFNMSDIVFVKMEVNNQEIWYDSKDQYNACFNESGIIAYKPGRSVMAIQIPEELKDETFHMRLKSTVAKVSNISNHSKRALILIPGQAADDLDNEEILYQDSPLQIVEKAMENVLHFADKAGAELKDLESMTIAVRPQSNKKETQTFIEDLSKEYENYLHKRGVSSKKLIIANAVEGPYEALFTSVFSIENQYEFKK